mmetsp:Transcript_47513/g.133725  ORF Transcript_47513/g.133725 Transcript_47513/m.133725 type:complete len:158 (-) Transcript_47513:90-563(-)
MASMGPPTSADLSRPPMPRGDPMGALPIEDRAFLEEFGRRIAVTVSGCLLVGGFGSYAMARQLGWRRRGLWTALGATLTPTAGWWAVTMSERDRVVGIAQQLHKAMEEVPMERGDRRSVSGDDALARLFPPPPMASLPRAGFPTGLGGPPGSGEGKW